jgi:two-component system sensor histidine kinase PilS (NtrC family)
LNALNPTSAAPATGIPYSPGWLRLRLHNYYRSALALFFFTMYINGWALRIIREDFDAGLFRLAATGYIIAALIFFVGIYRRRPGLATQHIIHTFLDIVFIIALMHASGGVRSGLGMLLVVSVSLTSLFLPLRASLVFAAIISLGILSEQIYSQLTIVNFTPAYIQAGLLGMLLFAFALLTSNVARRLRETEQLATDRSQALETAIHLNEHIIRNMRTGIMVVTPQGQIQLANHAATSLLGNIYLEPMMPLAKISPALYARFIEWHDNTLISSQKPVSQSHGLPDLQPGFSNIEPHLGRHGRTLVFLEDASQLNQRFQQVKLAALGRLTASIAHEIRNPLAAINHAAQLLDESEALPAADKKLTGIINTQVERLNDIIENVLQLSRQQRGHPETIELRSWLNNFRDEFCSSQGLRPEQLGIHVQPQDTRILFDASHLHQVMWNLCSNAINHAHMELGNLMINIQGGMTLDASQPFLDIIDNGAGIDEKAQQHIFEPFFTTSSSGTGLGLYITKEVVESNRAKIRHILLPTGGTCFRIHFIQPTASNPTT